VKLIPAHTVRIRATLPATTGKSGFR